MAAVIIHPVFWDCQDFTLDDFWKDIFFSCSCNKFPKGARYDATSRTLYVRVPTSATKTISEATVLPEKTEEIYKVVLKTFREKLGLFSYKDLQIRKTEMNEIRETRRIDTDCEWKKLKPRSIKAIKIAEYVTRLKEEHLMTVKEAKNLLGMINIGFQFKQITSDDVEYENSQVQNINGLEYCEKRKMWNITHKSRVVNKTEKTVTTQKFHQCIDGYLREYRSRRVKM